jgi:hypothetical protein
MPWVRVSRLPSTVPPRVGTTYAYLSLFVSVVGLNRLLERPRGRPCAFYTARGPVGTLLTL